jgi:cellulose synthase/poly-beta-1,6-N-acetylglucosamine synthase-like glycosyltransferase
MILLILSILTVVSTLALVHSYLLYPALLKWYAKGKSNNTMVFEKTDELPNVSVIMSLYNEEKVIAKKLQTLAAQNYPPSKINFFIGSDASTDKTNSIVENYIAEKTHFHFFPFPLRRGKPGVLNHLVQIALNKQPAGDNHILLLTDASVMLEPDVIYHLAKHFKNPQIAVVDSFMFHTGLEEAGISKSEDQYIHKEVSLKFLESVVWRKMIGPFGGCYAIRSNYFSEVPHNFLVDDFFITMKVFEKNGWAINEPLARCFEPVSTEWREEYRRKSRISAGNFQNMLLFLHLWWPPLRPLQFAFFSHKILRWLGPFFLISILLTTTCGMMLGYRIFTWFSLFLAILIGVVPILDVWFKKIGLNILIFRNIRYFFLMNIALLQGFFKYLKGIKSNVWEPTKRQ